MKTAYVSNPDSPAGAAITNGLRKNGFSLIPSGEDAPGAIFNEENIRRIASGLSGRVIDLMVCCPAALKLTSVEDGSEEDFDYMMNQNAKHPFFLTKHMGPHMAEEGKIIYIGSIHAEKPTGASFAYSCSMSAMKMLCKEAALSLGRERVCCVYLENGPMEGDDSLFDNPVTPIYDDMNTQFPGRRPGTWDEVARLVEMLADAPRILNGAEIRTDGGFTLNYLAR